MIIPRLQWPLVTYFFIQGGWSRPFNFESMIFTYWLGVMAWTCINNLGVVLGPCAQYCPYEYLEKKIGQKPKTFKNKVEISCLHHSIYLTELIILMWSDVKLSKSDKKWSSYADSNLGQKWRPGLFWAENWLFWLYLLRYGL